MKTAKSVLFKRALNYTLAGTADTVPFIKKGGVISTRHYVFIFEVNRHPHPLLPLRARECKY